MSTDKNIELEESIMNTSQILARVKSDHVTITKPEEDRRRRTIIVEKKTGTYGFTLQSYGIHYKKEQEIEMITYVDHVDYDGPAFIAGMREGDVILSINGHDMEKVDHKSLVNFIKGCESRMRMVVLFEDCVRKVELHMKYIRLQRKLQNKTDELERLCIREKELLSGKWKTHSLPARKKANSSTKNYEYALKIHTDSEDGYISRPAISTEDVAQARNGQRGNTQHFLIAYPHQPYYVDSRGRAYYVHSSNSNSSSKEYLVSIHGNWGPKPRSNSRSSNHSNTSSKNRNSDYANEETNDIHSNSSREKSSYSKKNVFTAGDRKNSVKNTNNENNSHEGTRVTRSRSYHQHICGACIAAGSPQENTALDVYDLASSPCCNSQCVPRRRRSRSQNQHKLKSSSSKTSLQTQSSTTTTKDLSEGYSNRSTQVNIPGGLKNGNIHRKHAKYNNRKKHEMPYSNLISQCSLQSFTSTEIGPELSQTVGDNSSVLYTTSLSTDTLYWDQPNSLQQVVRKNSVKSSNSFHDCQDVVKPIKSLDNLTTKTCGANRLGYEYLDKERSRSSSSKNIYVKKDATCMKPVKSSESLLFYSPNLSDASLNCCSYTDENTPTFISDENGRFVAIMPPSEQTNQRDKASQTDSSKRLVDIQQTPEITRL